MRKILLSLAASMLFLAACSEQSVQVPRLKPAKMHLGNLRTVAVASFDGPEGEQLATLFSDALEKTGRHTVVPRQRVTAAQMGAHLLGMNKNMAQDLAYGLGADAIVYGRVHETTAANVDRRQYGAQRDTDWLSVTYVRTSNLQVTVDLTALDAKTGNVVGSTHIVLPTVTRKDSREFSGPSWSELFALPFSGFDPVDQDAMRREAYSSLPARFMRRITPHYKTDVVTLYSDRRIPASKRAIEAAHQGDWDTAITLYRQGAQEADSRSGIASKYRARAHYNLGVALVYSGDTQAGLHALSHAMDLYPDKTFLQAYGRARLYAADIQRARAQSSQSCPDAFCALDAAEDDGE